MSAVWYVRRGDNSEGPYSLSDLNDLARSGEINSEDYVRSKQMNDWVKAADLPGLAFPAAAAGFDQPPPLKRSTLAGLPEAPPPLQSDSQRADPTFSTPQAPPATLSQPENSAGISPLSKILMVMVGICLLVLVFFVVLFFFMNDEIPSTDGDAGSDPVTDQDEFILNTTDDYEDLSSGDEAIILSSEDSTIESQTSSIESISYKGGTYTGQLLNGLPHGQGSYNNPDGTKYDGAWQIGEIHGKGMLVFSSGDIYDGSFVDGKRDGYGKMKYTNGGKYEGNFKDDLFHGNGTLTYKNGDVYVGEFKNGKENGYGKETFSDGHYEGNYKNGLFHGQGKLIIIDGSSYNGNFSEGKVTGSGIMIYVDGARHEGSFINGKRHGFGKYTYADGYVIEGQWDSDLPVR